MLKDYVFDVVGLSKAHRRYLELELGGLPEELSDGDALCVWVAHLLATALPVDSPDRDCVPGLMSKLRPYMDMAANRIKLGYVVVLAVIDGTYVGTTVDSKLWVLQDNTECTIKDVPVNWLGTTSYNLLTVFNTYKDKVNELAKKQHE